MMYVYMLTVVIVKDMSPTSFMDVPYLQTVLAPRRRSALGRFHIFPDVDGTHCCCERCDSRALLLNSKTLASAISNRDGMSHSRLGYSS